jgi:hypothetical protein
MGRSRLDVVAIGLLVCLPAVFLTATLPALAGQLTASHFSARPAPHAQQVWVDGPGVSRGTPLRISGTIEGAYSPGVFVPVNVSILNPNPRAATFGRITLKISAILAPRADHAHPCTRLDFEIRQMPEMTLRVPARRSVDLAGLGLPTRSWPQLGMRNLPLNQDGCKDAWLTLLYRAHRVR